MSKAIQHYEKYLENSSQTTNLELIVLSMDSPTLFSYLESQKKIGVCIRELKELTRAFVLETKKYFYRSRMIGK